jgi:AhpD family alkylhydroperoxidase
MNAHTARSSYPEFARLSPKVVAALNTLGTETHAQLDAELIELIKLRASQINGCAFCLQYHLELARKAKLNPLKIDLLAAWRDAGVFSAREQAALAWTEHLTEVAQHGAPDPAWADLQAHFSEAEVLAVLTAVVTINAWNRIAVGLRFAPLAAAQ